MKNLIYICVTLLLIFGGFLFGWKKGKRSVKPQITEVVQEKILWDTIKIKEPTLIPELIFIKDTVYIEILIEDTLQNVPLIKQTKTYQDSTYKAVVSGYNPNLDYIETYNKTIIQYIQPKPNNWSISALVGTSFTGDEGSFYGAGAVSYTEGIWTFTGEIGRDFTANKNYIGLELGINIASW